MDRGRHHGHGGHRGHARHGLQSGRKLSASDLQIIILAQLAASPVHGYEIIKLLEEHSHGLYIPSPGAIYPALTYLEEVGFATVETDGTKKRYSLTEAGRSYLEQNRETATRILNDMERIGTEMEQARQAIENGRLTEEKGRETVSTELETARRELRNAQHKDGPYTSDEEQRIAEILLTAAAAIRRLIEEHI